VPSFAPQAPPAAGELPQRPDRRGLRSDTAWVLGYQVATIGILYALPESISNWSEEQKEEYTLNKWWHNINRPQWDGDKFWINYLAHPYWGGAYYVRARERGFDELSSFWYSVGMSTLYEFGAEALFERPSIQDLVVTPVGGAIVGHYFMAARAQVDARYAPGQQKRFGDRVILALTDPIGAINHRIQSWLGIETQATLLPYVHRARPGEHRPWAEQDPGTEWVYGLRFDLRW
jgi:hypothetical protein